jgi:glutamine phosphoribosylpyrophosphate amidotransferase
MLYYIQTNVDSELFLHLISHSKRRSQIDQIFDAMTQVLTYADVC